MVPSLAESVTQVDDVTYEIKLNKGIKFHNGEEMKANDVKFTIHRIASQPCDIHYLFADVDLESFDTPDDYTVVFKINKPNAAFMSYLAFSAVGIVNEKAVNEFGDSYGMNPVGTGPYKLVKWSKGNESVLERFDDYHGEKALIKDVTIKVVPEPTNRLLELESGGADIAYDIAVTDVNRIEESDKLKIGIREATSSTFLGFNTQKKPFDDIRVREAIRYAIDVEGIVKSVYMGLCPPATNPMNPNCLYYDTSRTVSEYNVQKAKDLLAEAGYPDGFTARITTDDRKERIDMATIIQNQLSQIGITVEIDILEWGAYLSACYDGQQEMYMGGWTTFTPEPSISLTGTFSSSTMGSGGNMAFYANDKVDELLEAGIATSDPAEREKIYLDLQKEITDQCTWVYLSYGIQTVGLSKDIQNFKVHPSGYHTLYDISFK
jgi:peptide/nickel transport system substrate-binding protein